MAELQEALDWIGYRVDDVYGARVGKVEDIYVDSETNRAEWLVAKLGRFSDQHALIPLADAVVGAGHVWVPYERDLIRRSPVGTTGAPLSQAQETSLLTHYGIAAGRRAELSKLTAESTTATSVSYGSQASVIA